MTQKIKFCVDTAKWHAVTCIWAHPHFSNTVNMCLWNRWKISPALIVFLQWGFWSRRMSTLVWPCGQHSQGLLWLIVWLSKPWLTFTLDKCHQTQKQELSWQSMSTEKISSSLQSLEHFYYEQISQMSVIHLFQCWILDKSFKRCK